MDSKSQNRLKEYRKDAKLTLTMRYYVHVNALVRNLFRFVRQTLLRVINDRLGGYTSTGEFIEGLCRYVFVVSIEEIRRQQGHKYIIPDVSQNRAQMGKLQIKNDLARECLAEFLGTFILLIFGDGSVAQKVLSRGELGSALSIHWSWGIGVMLGIYVAGGVSGAHLNPAVTVAQSCLGRFPWKKVLPYMLAQYVGAFVAAACVYLVYYDALNNFDGGTRQVEGNFATAGIWATYPQIYVSTWNCLGDQVLGTALLLISILAITDPRNMQPTKGVTAISIGLTVVVIGMTFGLNCGYAINPARDLGPRIFTSVAGWGSDSFAYRDHNYFWVPVVGPHIGAVIGAYLYQLCVGLHWATEVVATESAAMTVEKQESSAYEGPYTANTHI